MQIKKHIYTMAEEATLNVVVQMLEAAPDQQCPLFQLMTLQLNARGLQFWSRLAKQRSYRRTSHTRAGETPFR